MVVRSLPALLMGLMMFAYWARVMRLVYKIRKQTGRSANLAPTKEPLGMFLRVFWYPAVLVWIAHPIHYALSRPTPPGPFWPFWPLFYHPVVAWTAVSVAAAAFAATLVCWKRMGKSWRMGITPGEKTQLIVTGPYAYVRHPIYALSSLLMLCTLAILPSPVMLAAGVIHLALLQWEAHREERYLLGVHGDVYGTYRASVGRFIPRSLSAHRPPADA